MGFGNYVHIFIRGKSSDIYDFCKMHCRNGILQFDTIIEEPKTEEDFPQEYKDMVWYVYDYDGSVTTSPTTIEDWRKFWRRKNWGSEGNGHSCAYAIDIPNKNHTIDEYDKTQCEFGFYAKSLPDFILERLARMHPELTISITIEPDFESPQYVFCENRVHNRDKFSPIFDSSSSRILDWIDREYDLIKTGDSVMVLEDDGEWQKVVDYKIIKRFGDLPFNVILSNLVPNEYDDSFALESYILNRYLKQNGHLVLRAFEGQVFDSLLESLEIKFEKVKIHDFGDERYVVCLNANTEKFNTCVSDAKNFRYLDDLIHSGEKEIVLDSDIVLGSDEKSKYYTGIQLDVDGVVIDGDGHAIDACGKTRIFECTGKNIIIRNVRFLNGYSWQGGAICNNGDVRVIDSYFVGNFSSDDGGAVYNEKNMEICRCRFLGNEASYSGGAIANADADLRVEDSRFFDNVADYNGAIDTYGAGKFNTKGCRFEYNRPDDYF